MSTLNLVLGIAALGFVVVTIVLSRSGMLPVEAAAARVFGYAVTTVLAFVGVPVVLAVIPAVVGVALGYVLVVHAARSQRGSGQESD